MLNTHATADPDDDGLVIGPLSLTFDDGNAGQRLSLTGEDNTIMPYYQVVATTRTGTDVGHAVAGYQCHLGPDTGGGTNREFFYIEAVGENDLTFGPHFRTGTWSSGTGVKRPLQIGVGGTPTMIFYPAVGGVQRVEVLEPIHLKDDVFIGSISLTEYIHDTVAALLVDGAGVTLTYNDGAGTLTITAP